jgi:hypothetical protein
MEDMKATEIEFLRQTVSRTDKSGNEKVLLLMDFIYTREQALSQHDVSGCTCPVESTDVYDDNRNYLGYVCLGCGYFSKY